MAVFGIGILPLFATVTVAFPKPGDRLPQVDRTWMSGAVSREVKSLKVQGKDVEIYRTGAWLAMVSVSGGENSIEIIADGATTNVSIKVQHGKIAAAGDAPQAAGKQPVYKKLPYAADEAKKHPSGKTPGETTIAIDPGHGGEKDTGATSPHGHFEKDANLALAFEVRRALEALGYKVKMTRETDRPLVLTDRARIACGEDGADAFVSIHHNSTPYDRDPRLARYTSVYEWNAIGKALAEKISARVGAALEGDVENRGVLHANFAVTRNPEVPSCLVEADFLNTPEGEEAVWNGVRRRKIGEAIAAGIDEWCKGDAGSKGESS